MNCISFYQKLLLITVIFFIHSRGFAQESVKIYTGAPEVVTSSVEGETLGNGVTRTTELFNGFSAPDDNWAPSPGGFNSSIGNYIQTSGAGTSDIRPDDTYGTGTGDYLSIAVGGTVELTFDSPVRYFGFAWPAGDGQNTIEIFSGNLSLGTFTTDNVVNFLPNDPNTTITSLNNTTYNTQDYYCKPGTTSNCNEPYAYLHIVTSEGLEFDRVEFSMGAGGRFETDNHTLINDAPATNGTWVEIFSHQPPTANDDSENGDTGDPVTVNVINNDLPGSDTDGNTVPLDPTTVQIVGTSNPGDPLNVSGEGTWSVNSTTGEITFTPDVGFEDDPTPIEYIILDEDGFASNQATVTIYYPQIVSLNGGSCWRLLSSPVVNTSYAELLNPIWTQGATGADYEGGDNHIYTWPVNQSGNDTSFWTPVNNLTNNIPAGSGFLVSVFADDDYDGTDDSFPKNLSVTGPENSAVLFTNMNENANGWTLLGNPFKESISFSSLYGESNTSGIRDAAYVYDRATGSWVSSAADEYGDLQDGAIAPFQGFFVQNIGSGFSSSQVDFTEETKTSGGNFYGKKAQQNYVRLEINGESVTNSAWIRFSQNGAAYHTKGDALELESLGAKFVSLAVQKEDDKLYDIAHLPTPDTSINIPLHIKSTISGDFSIEITDIDLPKDLHVELVDLEENIKIPLSTRTTYQFDLKNKERDLATNCLEIAEQSSLQSKPVAAKSSSNQRFYLQVRMSSSKEVPSNIGLHQNYPNPFNPTTQITYQLPQQSDVLLEVYDLTGKLISTLVNETISSGSHSVTFNATHLSSGIYMYRLQTGNKVFSRKLTVIK